MDDLVRELRAKSEVYSRLRIAVMQAPPPKEKDAETLCYEMPRLPASIAEWMWNNGQWLTGGLFGLNGKPWAAALLWEAPPEAEYDLTVEYEAGVATMNELAKAMRKAKSALNAPADCEIISPDARSKEIRLRATDLARLAAILMNEGLLTATEEGEPAPYPANPFALLAQCLENAGGTERSPMPAKDKPQERKGASTEAEATNTADNEPRLTVDRWSDLAIGIDEDGSYLAVTPLPEPGERFVKRNAIPLKLPGKQWKALLDLLARSSDGRTAAKRDVITVFGYMKLPETTDDDLLEELRSDSGAMEELKTANRRLTAAISNLSRRLRDQVSGPIGRDAPTVLSVASDDQIEAVFVVRHLLRDSGGDLRFGQPAVV